MKQTLGNEGARPRCEGLLTLRGANFTGNSAYDDVETCAPTIVQQLSKEGRAEHVINTNLIQLMGFPACCARAARTLFTTQEAQQQRPSSGGHPESITSRCYVASLTVHERHENYKGALCGLDRSTKFQ